MGHIDASTQPPLTLLDNGTGTGTGARARKPWSRLLALDFVRQVDLIVPQECAEAVRQKLEDSNAGMGGLAGRTPQYERVVMALGDLLEGRFYTDYIKAGNILMLSEGRPGQDSSVFTLKGGQLTLFLDRETYERTGLVGQVHGAKGGRGLRPRWMVQFDLHSNAMSPGKKGFERLKYACKNVLNTPLTWLFYNHFDTPEPDPLAPYSPARCTVVPNVTAHWAVTLPLLERPQSLLSADENAAGRLEAEEAMVELYEWLSLVRLGSPRVQAGDQIDPYLSRYRVPGALEEDEKSHSTSRTAASAPAEVCLVRWRGFLPASWVCQTLFDALAALPSSQTWIALSASAFPTSKSLAKDTAECTFFRPCKAPGEYLLWEVHGHE